MPAPETVNMTIRGYASGQIQFEESVSCSDADINTLLPILAETHALALATHALHMIEIEFLDEPDVNQRYFRFGTDPAAMVAPFAIELPKEQ